MSTKTKKILPREFDADYEPRLPRSSPPSRRQFRTLSAEILDRAESHRASGSAVPFFELEDWSKEVRRMELAIQGAQARLTYGIGMLKVRDQLAAALRPKGKAKG